MSATETRKNHITAILIALAGLAILIALAAAGLALVQRFDTTNQRRDQQAQFNAALAKSQRHQSEVIRTVLCLAQAQVVNDETVTQERKDRAVEFYTAALIKIHMKPCPTPEVKP